MLSIIIIFIIIYYAKKNFITNDILSLALAVGCIKLLKFKNLKQAIICCSTVLLC